MGPPTPGGTWAVGVCALTCMGQGNQPQEAHAPRDKERKSPKGGRHLRGALGRRDSSLAASFLGGRAKAAPPPPPLPLYICGGWEGSHTNVLVQPSPSPKFFSSPVVLGEALQDCHAPPPPPRRCAAVGWSLPQPLPLSLLDQGVGDIVELYVC